ncbi:hypothetical protein [Ascidiimonas sp. W6]|uniref:hypothetical protein n=1 Tax=Ascidiimonas meishanensis TaxID=3128903 RepID=UPI0030EE6C78
MENEKMKIVLIILCLISIHSFGQKQINLADQLQNKKIKAVNRVISLYGDASGAIEMNAKDGDGLGILEDVEFEKGIIEVELLGENNPGKSFIGIAFNIQNDSTFEALYFRPFNFVAKKQIRKDHMVQYICHPEFTWRKLRNNRTGEFEDEISDPPNPDGWFKAIIKINDDTIKVYLNEIAEPILSVDRLTKIKSNKIGVWTGFGSSGRFKNLVLQTD